MFESSVKYQLFATLYANINSLIYGVNIGWPSVNLVYLQSDSTILSSGRITLEEATWIGSILFFAGMFGTILYGWLSNMYGRKCLLLSLAIPQTIAWLLIIIATNPTYIYISRFLAGISAGGLFIIIQLFVTEIAEDKVRGFLGSLFLLSVSGGILLAYVLGNYMSYKLTSIVLIIFPILFFLGFLFFPDTPQSLIKYGKEEDAERSLRFYRNINLINQTTQSLEAIKMELIIMRNSCMDGQKKTKLKVTMDDFTNRAAIKAISISIILVVLNQLSGVFAMLTYTVAIFAEAGTDLTPNMAAIVIGVIMLCGTYMATMLVERAGRKVLLGVSALGTGIALFIFGIYTYMKSDGYTLELYQWVPLVCISFSVFFASLGIISIPFLVIAEIIPIKIRSYVTTFCMLIVWIFAFLTVKYFPILSAVLGFHVCLFGFAIISISGALFLWIYMPETKGKSIADITKMLES